MDWPTYRSRYDVFTASLGASGLLGHIGSIILQDFPNNLPPCLRVYVCKKMTEILLSAEKLDDKKNSEIRDLKIGPQTHEPQSERCSTNDREDELILSSLLLSVGELGMSQSIQWDKFARAQHLVMIFAYFDAFFSDSVRAICELCPEILRQDKKISWRAVLEEGSWDSLCQRLVEEYVHDLCWEGVVERLQVLEEKHSLSLNIPNGELEAMKYAELVRNLVVHTGGRITPEFMRRAVSFTLGLKIGDFITIDFDFLQKTRDSILMAGTALFHTVATKFFGISNDSIGSIWSRPDNG